jgi:hypothetical protein
MLGEGQLIRELKLGRVNQDRMRKWVKIVYVPESTYSTTKGGGYHLKPPVPFTLLDQASIQFFSKFN